MKNERKIQVYATLNVRLEDRYRFDRIQELMGTKSAVDAFARLLDMVDVSAMRKARIEALTTEGEVLSVYGDIIGP